MMLPPDHSVLPPPLDSLDPAQMARWAIRDDVDRDRAIVDARTDELELLVSVFDARMFEALNALFDSYGEHPPESVCWLLDVGQAAMEARMELDNRQR